MTNIMFAFSDEKSPGVYILVVKYLKWIQETVGKHSQ